MARFQVLVNPENFTVDVIDSDGDMIRVDTELDAYVCFGTCRSDDEKTIRIVGVPEVAVDEIIKALQAWKTRRAARTN